PDTCLAARLKEVTDGHLGDSDAPFFVAKESARGPTDCVSGLSDDESHHLTVRRSERWGDRRRRRWALQVCGLAQEEVLTHVRRPSHHPEVHLVNVLSKGVKGRPKVPGSECDAAAAICDAAQDRARDRVRVVNGPQTRRDPPIRGFVVMLKRPYAVARPAQDFAIEATQPALEKELQVVGTDPANVGFSVTVCARA